MKKITKLKRENKNKKIYKHLLKESLPVRTEFKGLRC